MNDTQHELQAMFAAGKVECKACREKIVGKLKVCYACARGLTGSLKPDADDDDTPADVWTCECSTWQCRCADAELAYCPICDKRFAESDYLAGIFADDPRCRWLANMVTHYRHQHRTWDRQVQYISRHRPDAYDDAKATVNEQGKRQIIRKARAYLIAQGIHAGHFKRLQGTTEQTMALAHKHLPEPGEAGASC